MISITVKELGTTGMATVTLSIPPGASLCLGLFGGNERVNLVDELRKAASMLEKEVEA